jgi:hypothetical protein
MKRRTWMNRRKEMSLRGRGKRGMSRGKNR